MKRIRYNKTITHILAAIFSLLLLRSEISFTRQNSLWDMLSGILVVGLFYTHALVLVPRLLGQRKINNYILLTFGVFATSAVFLAIFSVAARKDYIYVFTLILEKGIGYSNQMLYLYETKYFTSLSLFVFSFVYGYLVSNTKDKLSYLGSLVFRMKSTEFLLHVVFLVVLLITAYFKEFLFDSVLFGCLLLFYFHLLLTTTFLFKTKKRNLFALFTLIEILVFTGLTSNLIAMQPGANISIGVMVMTYSTIYSFLKHQVREQKSLFTRKEAELEQLKSQINPHFLFNSLNTLYSFAMKENAEKTASNIKKFSNIIRFTLSDINEAFIPLEKEIGYINDYVDIQLARCPVKQNVELNFSNCGGYHIAPMLLIPFIENAFKHGINPFEESTLIVNLECNADKTSFECVNTLNNKAVAGNKEGGFGIGIKNIKSRLLLIYPDRHHLSIGEEGKNFKVKLEIYDNSNSN